jgi:predicted DNA-binding transcriptional regulator AlpA
MSTNDNITLLRFPDLVARRIVSNRMTLRRWMARPIDPFPQPIVLATSARQNHLIAWRASDVAAWLERRSAAKRI